MKQGIFEIIENTQIAANSYLLRLAGDSSAVTAPGQFVSIMVDGFFLRRPLSVCDAAPGGLQLIYKTVGKGTAALAALKPGARLDILSGLGNGFDTAPSGGRPLLIGGGAGVSPMYMLAKSLLREGKKPTVVIGFNSADELFFIDEFNALGAKLIVTTADGSYGVHGLVSDGAKLAGPCSYYFACGPEPMLKALYNTLPLDGQLSFEARMACGFGACMGCSCKTLYGNKRICRDGPVLHTNEVIFE